MTRQLINIGTTANDGAGDPLRTAFNKINNNFIELYSGLPALSIGATPPINPAVGQQWWDDQDGNSYIYYGGNWVPTTSTVSLQSNNVRIAAGNTININFKSDGIITNTLSSNASISFVNFTAGVRVRVILTAMSTAYSATLGVPAARSSNGSLYAQASTVPSTITLDYICTGTDINSVYVTVADSAAGIPPVNAVLDLSAVAQDIVPATDVTYNLGSLTHQWKSLYVSSNTIYVGGTPLTVSGSTLTINGQPVSGGGGVSVTESNTAPSNPAVGNLWYDTVGGRMYIYYDSTWVDTNPLAEATPGNKLVNGNFNFTLGVDGTVNFDPSSANGKGILQTAADLQLIAVDKVWTFGDNGDTTMPLNGNTLLNYGHLYFGDYGVGTNMFVDEGLNLQIYTNTSGQRSGNWIFGTNGSTTLPSGAGFGFGESGQLKVNDGTTLSLDIRDQSGRGFYTNSDGYTLRSNGTYNWIFRSDGSLTLPTGGTISYTPTTSSDWSGTAPVTIQEALDRLAAAFKILNNGTGA